VTDGQFLCRLVIIIFHFVDHFCSIQLQLGVHHCRKLSPENRSTANARNIANSAPHNAGESPLMHFIMHVIHVQFCDHTATEQYNHFLVRDLVSSNALFVSSACHMMCIFHTFQYCTTSCRVLTAIHLFRH